MAQIRSHAEMYEIYQQRAAEGLEPPVLLEYANDKQLLLFFGSSHSNNPDDEQWPALEENWNKFVTHQNGNKTVITESHLSPGELAGKSREQALAEHSESGLTLWLAGQAGIAAESGEPSREAEINHLKRSYSDAQIMTYYFGRQMHQWVTRDYRTNPDWQPYAADCVQKYYSLGVWGEQFDLDRVLAWFAENTGKPFDPQDKELLYALSDPSQSEVSSASGRFRDEHLKELIQDKWQEGQDVFVVYGSGHAIVLEPVLKELTR